MRLSPLCLSISAALLFAAVATPAHAQQGCVNSPENPTGVLFLVGAAGAAVPHLRARYKRAKAEAHLRSTAPGAAVVPIDFVPDTAPDGFPPAI